MYAEKSQIPVRALVLLLAAVATGALSAPVDGRPEYHGFSVALPDSIPPFQRQSAPPRFTRERTILATLNLDTDGLVTACDVDDRRDSSFLTYLSPWLYGWHFHAATFNDRPVGSVVPVRIQIHPQIYTPEVILPVASDGRIPDAGLYFHALRKNDIMPPAIERFPSYYCNLTSSDSTNSYRYVLLRLQLDTTGQVLSVQPVASTFPAFTSQIESAALWATFSPLRLMGVAKGTGCYLLISFFPRVTYPTSVWIDTLAGDMGVLHNRRVRLLPDTVGLMATPLPAWAAGDRITLTGRHPAVTETASAQLSIDTVGGVTMRRISASSRAVKEAIRQLGDRMRFYPARSYDGRSRPYTGLATFYFENSANIRIEYQWLDTGRSRNLP